MPGTAAKVRVSEKQWAVLQEFSRSRTVAKGIVQRALILVRGGSGAAQRADRGRGGTEPATGRCLAAAVA
jgi:hypothetical protein